ncbi:MAG: DMT family protein [Gemmataceae bacterium]|nr:DMT family protein [Gemmataceae bacterium]
MRTIVFTVLLLVASNTFMTIAWYGHLKHKDKALLAVILVSWLIALPEYALQVPANRMGSAVMTGTQLKLMQEVITLCVFVVFAWLYLGEKPTWRTAAAFGLIVLAVALVRGDGPKPKEESVPAEAQPG